MDSWCPRCGETISEEPDLPCRRCWDGYCGAELTWRLIERAEGGSRPALGLLRAIEDAAAVPALRSAAAFGDAGVRAAAVGSLARSAGHAELPRVVAALHDPEASVRQVARAELAELGGATATEALAATLDEVEGEELDELVQALAWLRDPRALSPAREIAHAKLGSSSVTTRRNAVWALVRLGHIGDRRALIDGMLALAPQGDPASHSWSQARQAHGQVFAALSREVPDEAAQALDELYAEDPERASRIAGRYRVPETQETIIEPVERRTVARLTLAELLVDRPAASGSPPARFGGQPDWIEAPAWPHDSDGRPLIFLGQLPLTDGPGRIAYIFVSAAERAETWRALSEGNAVVVQPGAPPELCTVPLSNGPALFESRPDSFGRSRTKRRYERYVRLEAGHDPPAWTWPELAEGQWPADPPGDWNKIGGTPRFLQGVEGPPGEGWKFAFQFSADWAGRELGDGAECYGFTRANGTAALLWQCH